MLKFQILSAEENTINQKLTGYVGLKIYFLWISVDPPVPPSHPIVLSLQMKCLVELVGPVVWASTGLIFSVSPSFLRAPARCSLGNWKRSWWEPKSWLKSLAGNRMSGIVWRRQTMNRHSHFSQGEHCLQLMRNSKTSGVRRVICVLFYRRLFVVKRSC